MTLTNAEQVRDRYVAEAHPWDEGQVDHFLMWLDHKGFIVADRSDDGSLGPAPKSGGGLADA